MSAAIGAFIFAAVSLATAIVLFVSAPQLSSSMNDLQSKMGSTSRLAKTSPGSLRVVGVVALAAACLGVVLGIRQLLT